MNEEPAANRVYYRELVEERSALEREIASLQARRDELGRDAADGEGRERRGWLDERLGTRAFYMKFGRKAFPIHTTFFFGEMASFAFVILVLTGIYLGLIYTPSNVEIDINGTALPQAFASTQLIESIPVANVFRNVHHWAAHLMVFSILLHMVRIFFTGTYRKPRELNWVIGVALLGLTLMAGFVGYALPYDSFSVTATGIGYGIARSIPLVGNIAADVFFGGTFPTLGSLPRLYTIHVFVLPAMLASVIGLHVLFVIKQKHTQPGYARKLAEPGRVLGVPLWPYQALLAGQLLFLMFGGLFLLSAFLPIHPLAAYGPPGGGASDVKPDWYLMWIYGFLKMVPSSAVFSTPIGTIGPEFIGGVLFPGAIFTLITVAPWVDRTNRRGDRFEYLQPATQAPSRLAWGIGLLTYIGMMFVAAFYDEIGLSLGIMWVISLVVPLLVGLLTFMWARTNLAAESQFDPRVQSKRRGVLTTPAD